MAEELFNRILRRRNIKMAIILFFGSRTSWMEQNSDSEIYIFDFQSSATLSSLSSNQCFRWFDLETLCAGENKISRHVSAT